MKREFPTNIYVPANVKPVTVIRVVSSVFGVSKAGLLTKGVRSCVDARQVACVLLRKSGRSLQETADFFNIDTSSVCNAQKVVPNKYEGDKLFASKFDLTLAALNGKGFNLSVKEARVLAMKTETGQQAIKRHDFMSTNIGDAAVFFLEGYNYALEQLKLT